MARSEYRPARHWHALLALCLSGMCTAASATGQDSEVLEPVRAAIRLKNFPAAALLLQTQAVSGNANAQYLLGSLYQNGLGLSVDEPAARQWFGKAAQQGHADAAYSLAALLAGDEPADAGAIHHWLQVAAQAGHPLASQALTAGIQPQKFQPDKTLRDTETRRQAFWLAVQQDDVELMTQLGVAQFSQATDGFGRTALSQAARQGAIHATRRLLESATVINQPDHAGITPLMLAAAAGHPEVAAQLLTAGALIDLQDSFGNTALMYAIGNGHDEVAMQLLNQHCNVRLTNVQGWSALDWAIKAQSTGLVDTLHALGLNSQRKATLSAGTPAIPLQHAKSFDVYRAWPDALIAASRARPDLFLSVIKAGNTGNAIGPNDETALMVAVQAGNSAVVTRLLTDGAKINAQSRETPLSWALRHNQPSMVNLLLGSGVSANTHGKSEAAPLLDAVRQGNDVLTRALLTAVADTEVRDRSGQTALMLAADMNRTEILAALIRSGANLDATDGAGHTALWHAAAQGATDCIQLLVQSRAALDKRAGNSSTPLMAALLNGQNSSAELLIAAGAGLQMLHDGATVLMITAARGNENLTRRLIAGGARLNAQNNFGDTALMLAVRNGQTAMARSLIAAGASTQLRNNDHASALDIATNLGHQELISVLNQGS